MGKRGCFFPRDNALVSARKSHSSGVRGLVVRCLLFNPEGSCSNPWVCATFLQVFRSRYSSLFRLCEFFFENFLMSSKGPPFNLFWYFATEWLLKNLKGPLFTVFGIVRNFKRIIFVLKLGFLRPSTLYPNFVFFLKTGDFFMLLFSNLFSSKPPLNFCLKWNVLRA